MLKFYFFFFPPSNVCEYCVGEVGSKEETHEVRKGREEGRKGRGREGGKKEGRKGRK